MSPRDGLRLFAALWVAIAKELLRENPWPWEASPSGSHKAISQLEVGAFFAWIGEKAVANGGYVERNALWEEWAESDLEVHGKTLKDLKSIGAYENTAKRIKKAIADNMKHLVKFGLFEDRKDHLYVITSKGRKYVEILSPRDKLPVAAE
jgi:hypothetical protein